MDAAALLRRALTRLGGKGGGTSSLAQGGGPIAPPAAIQAALQEALSG